MAKKKAKKVSIWSKIWSFIVSIWRNAFKILGIILGILIVIILVSALTGGLKVFYRMDQGQTQTNDQGQTQTNDQGQTQTSDQGQTQTNDQGQTQTNDQACTKLPLRSADVTDKFSGYVEYQAQGWIVPSCTEQDSIISQVGSALVTWCNTQNSCSYIVVESGQPIPHEGEINLYVPGFVTYQGELKYINPDATWTPVQ